MKHVTLLTTLASLSLAACDNSDMTPPRVHAGAGITPAQPGLAAASDSVGPASSSAQSDLARGQQVYRQTCAFCHDQGIAGAPIIGEVGAWSPRLAQGMVTLYASALQGRNAMPPKGGNPSLADADVRAAVDYLVGQAR